MSSRPYWVFSVEGSPRTMSGCSTKYWLTVKPSGVFAQLHPVRLPVDGPVTFLQEDDVRYDLGSGVLFESVIGQADGPQQVGPLGQVLAGAAVFGVQRVPAGDKCHHAARADLVQGFGEEVVMDGKTEVVVGFVVDLVVAKGTLPTARS